MTKAQVTYGKLSPEAKAMLSKRNSQSLAANVAAVPRSSSWRVKLAYICFVLSLIAVSVSFIMGLCATGETREVEKYSYHSLSPSYETVHVPDPMRGVYFQLAGELLGGALFILFVASTTDRLEAIAARRNNLKEQWDFYAGVMYFAVVVIFITGLLLWAGMRGFSGFFMFLVLLLFESIPLCLARVANIVKALYLNEDAPSPESLPKDGEADVLQTLGISK